MTALPPKADIDRAPDISAAGISEAVFRSRLGEPAKPPNDGA
jgi:hypothetical protein